MTEERSAGHDITLPNSSPTNPNIGRDKVEPLYPRDECDADLAESLAILGRHPCRVPVSHAINIVGSMIRHLQSDITVSEKRAETAEQLAEDWQCEYDKVLEERDAERTESARAFATAAAALRERDEARAVSDSLAEYLHELQADRVTCQSERDSARSSLMRVRDALEDMLAVSEGLTGSGDACDALHKASTKARSALSPHPERENG